MRYNTYEEFKRAEEKRVNECPLFFAFSQEQLDKALEERHATVNDIYQISSISGAFYLKKDSQAVRDYFEHETGLEECMKDHDFAVSAFYYEMCNHEYGIDYYQRNWDVLNCFSGFELEYRDDDSFKYYLEQMGHPEWLPWYKEARVQYYKAAKENEWF